MSAPESAMTRRLELWRRRPLGDNQSLASPEGSPDVTGLNEDLYEAIPQGVGDLFEPVIGDPEGWRPGDVGDERRPHLDEEALGEILRCPDDNVLFRVGELQDEDDEPAHRKRRQYRLNGFWLWRIRRRG